MHTYALGGKKCSFFGKFDVLCFLENPVLRFALLPYYQQIKKISWGSRYESANSQREICPKAEFSWSAFFCIQSEYRKYGTEKTPHLDTFHAVILKGMHFYWEIMNNITNNSAYFSKQAFWNHWPLNLHSRRFLSLRNFLSSGSFDQCQKNCLIVSTKFKIPLFEIKLSKKRSFLP